MIECKIRERAIICALIFKIRSNIMTNSEKAAAVDSNFISDKKNILEAVNSPEDLKGLSVGELNQLCSEIRTMLIDTVSKTGGHLASNLGVVELTVALHKSFDSPKDTIIFDVGHQCYTHKILTGRKDVFYRLRQEGGLSGFPRPQESEHDPFITGHASTSISAAYGFARGNALNLSDGYVVAIIGDGALTGGLAYEGLNNAGRSKDKLIVILNDNKMSISRNVGGIARYLATIRSKPGYFKMKQAVEKFVQRIPLIGQRLRNWMLKSKTRIKNVLDHSTCFEDMGFSYLGPVDGHDMNKLLSVLETAKNMKRPTLIHINTIKGKGYTHAEKNPKNYHGIPSFDIETGDYQSGTDNFSYIFGATLCKIATDDDRICAVTAAMTEGTGLGMFRSLFKDRFYDVGIAEEHAVTFSCGLARKGLVPVFAVYSSFLQRSYDQILHDAATQGLKLVLGVDRAGIVGEDGETHQGLFDVAFLRTVPGIYIYSPSTYAETELFLKLAIYDAPSVAAVRYPRGAQPHISIPYISKDLPFDVIESGKNSDTAVITYGRTFGSVCDAYLKLTDSGNQVDIIKLNRIWPLRDDLYERLEDYKNIFVFEEVMENGGIGEHIAYTLLRRGYKGNFKVTAIKDGFVPQSTVSSALKKHQLDADSVVDIILSKIGHGE